MVPFRTASWGPGGRRDPPPVTLLVGDFPGLAALLSPSRGGEVASTDAISALACVAGRGWHGVSGLVLRGECHLHLGRLLSDLGCQLLISGRGQMDGVAPL